jgi:hypothetical protein
VGKFFHCVTPIPTCQSRYIFLEHWNIGTKRRFLQQNHALILFQRIFILEQTEQTAWNKVKRGLARIGAA